MTYLEAKEIRQQQLQGVAVSPKLLERALAVIKTGEDEPPELVPEGPKPNPWGLSEREAESITAMIEHGRAKTAALAMGISPKTAEVYCCNVRKKMGVSSLVQAAVKWDRYLREQVAA